MKLREKSLKYCFQMKGPLEMYFEFICTYFKCIIQLVSKTTRELLLEWNKWSPVDLSADLKMPQFTVEDVVTDKCEESSLIGNYSCLVAKFHLRQHS